MGPLRWKLQPCRRARRACERQGSDRRADHASPSRSGHRNAASPTCTKVRRRVRATVNASGAPDGVSVVGWGAIDPGARRVDVRVVRAERQRSRDLRCRRHAEQRPTSHRSPTSIASMTHEWGHAHGPRPLGHRVGARWRARRARSTTRWSRRRRDDLRGCRCQYGLPGGASAAYACSLPGEDRLRQRAPWARRRRTQTVTMTNSGNAPLSIQTSTVGEPAVPACRRAARRARSCMPGAELHDAGAGDAGRQRCRRVASSRCSPTTATTNVALASNGVTRGDRRRQRQPTVERRRVLQRRARPLLPDLDRRRNGEPRRRSTADALGAHRAHVPGVRQSAAGRRARCAASTSRRRYGNSHFFGRSAAECAASQQRAARLRARRSRLHARGVAECRQRARRHAARLPALQQSRGRQSPLHDRSRGARPDGGARAGSRKAMGRTQVAMCVTGV